MKGWPAWGGPSARVQEEGGVAGPSVGGARAPVAVVEHGRCGGGASEPAPLLPGFSLQEAEGRLGDQC